MTPTISNLNINAASLDAATNKENPIYIIKFGLSPSVAQ